MVDDIKEPKDLIQADVDQVINLEHTVQQINDELSNNEAFRALLAKQKQAQEQIATFWNNIKSQMIEHNIKNLRGDWGYITIAERIAFDVDETQLPAKFFKKVVDIKRIGDTYKLEGKDIKGATVKYTKYLTKGIK